MRVLKWIAGSAAVVGLTVGLFLSLHGSAIPQTGVYQTTVTPDTSAVRVSELARRLGWGSGEPVGPYDASARQLVVYVPPDYTPAKPAGLLVAVQLGSGHAPPTLRLKALLNQSNLILISCNENSLSPPRQAQRLLDIAAQFRGRYAIDPKRIYLAETDENHFVPFAVADVYTGFISLRKLILYEDARTQTKEGTVVSSPHDKHRPADAMIALAKRRPFVFLMDPETDADMKFYRDAIIEQMNRDGYSRLEKIPIGSDENRYPAFTGDWFGRAIQFLDGAGGEPYRPAALKP
jgi:hypothetical protein